MKVSPLKPVPWLSYRRCCPDTSLKPPFHFELLPLLLPLLLLLRPCVPLPSAAAAAVSSPLLLGGRGRRTRGLSRFSSRSENRPERGAWTCRV